jgi:membrane fusion protein, copper/silver efflux system
MEAVMRFVIFLLMLFSFSSAVFAAEDYICPMHPHIHGNKGDHCPVCGMELVPAPAQSKPPARKEGKILIDPSYTQLLGVKTAPAEKRFFGRDIRAWGQMKAPSGLTHVVSLRKGGWIVKLSANATGQKVKKGDLLFTLYSPDLMTAQADYLAVAKGGFFPANNESRLSLYGMGAEAIALLKEKKDVLQETPFYAPADGIVLELSAREGSFVEEGGAVMTLQDYAQVWVEARMPVRDIGFIAAETPATVTLPQTGEVFSATGGTVFPDADHQSGFGMVRLTLDNAGGKLKPGVYADVVFKAEGKERLAVPAEAVLYGKDSARVIVSSGEGSFEARPVQAGITSEGLTEIASGLAEGETIVVSGQFMIDAESSLSGGMSGMDGMDVKTESKAGEEHVH